MVVVVVVVVVAVAVAVAIVVVAIVTVIILQNLSDSLLHATYVYFKHELKKLIHEEKTNENHDHDVLKCDQDTMAVFD